MYSFTPLTLLKTGLADLTLCLIDVSRKPCLLPAFRVMDVQQQDELIRGEWEGDAVVPEAGIKTIRAGSIPILGPHEITTWSLSAL